MINNSIPEKVLKAIDSGKVKMRPRWHFVFRTALWAMGVILAALTLLYLVSFVIFALHQSGSWFVPGFGLRGLPIFLSSIPWLLVAVALIFIILLEVLVKRYSFAYARPLLYSVIAVILFVMLGGLVVAKTPLHRGLFRQALENHLPLAGGLYRGYGMMRPRNIALGIVTEIPDAGRFLIQNRVGEIIEVMVTAETYFPFGKDIAVGDTIVAFGQQQNGRIKAWGVRKIIVADFLPRPPHMQEIRVK